MPGVYMSLSGTQDSTVYLRNCLIALLAVALICVMTALGFLIYCRCYYIKPKPSVAIVTYHVQRKNPTAVSGSKPSRVFPV